MEIQVTGTPKEIAALALELQERPIDTGKSNFREEKYRVRCHNCGKLIDIRQKYCHYCGVSTSGGRSSKLRGETNPSLKKDVSAPHSGQ